PPQYLSRDVNAKYEIALHINNVRSVPCSRYECIPLLSQQPYCNYGSVGSRSSLRERITSSKDYVVIDIDSDSENETSNTNRVDSTSQSVVINIGSASATGVGQEVESSQKSSLYAVLEQTAKNLGLSLGRNLFSVGIPTAAREYVRRGIAPHIPDTALKGMGGVACGLPVALELIGLARECHNKTYTKESITARVANILTVSAASAGLVVSGNFIAAAPTLIAAVFCYVPMRDAIQYFVQLSDNNSSGINGKATLGTSTAYVANQTAVDQLMTIVSDALAPYVGSVAANVLGRAIVNIAGESTDDMTNAGFNALAKKNDNLQFSLAFRDKENITLASALDQVFTTLAGRASLFTTGFAVAYTLPFSGVLASAAVGLTLGLGYIPFVYSHDQKKVPQSNDQSIDSMERGQAESSVSTQDIPVSIEIITERDTALVNT
ncbi:MAG: hypothetical protein ACRCZ4_05705, partial [Plesiomonas sp.]|uniref:hypothetical protein n=1 Tax=Plesiomonas sp. TaxID=2486279 RepID=UPI003F2EAB37